MTDETDMIKKSYAGIGARKTPSLVLQDMNGIGAILRNKGYVLRSGGAKGADQAFEKGSAQLELGLKMQKEIYIPWSGFNGYDDNAPGIINAESLDNYKEAQVIAKTFHPAWKNLSSTAKKFHSRNVYQVLGLSLKDPSDFIVCWTPDGKASGGTGQAIRIGKAYGATIYNLNSDYQPMWGYL